MTQEVVDNIKSGHVDTLSNSPFKPVKLKDLPGKVLKEHTKNEFIPLMLPRQDELILFQHSLARMPDSIIEYINGGTLLEQAYFLYMNALEQSTNFYVRL